MSGRSLRRLYQFTTIPFKLLVIDCGIPARYLKGIEAAVAGQEDVEFIKTNGPLVSNACKALVAEASTDDLTCMLENDIMVTAGWLESLIAAMEETGAEVAVPRIYEGKGEHHSDDHVGTLEFGQGEKGVELHVAPLGESRKLDRLEEPRLVTMGEAHCLLFRTNVLKRLKVFDPEVTCREEFDICLALQAASVPMVFEARSRVFYVPPPPVYAEEKPYFLLKWDEDAAIRTHEYIKNKWSLSTIPSGYATVRNRNHQLSRSSWFLYRVRHRWRSAPAKAWKTLRQNTISRLSKRARSLSL